MSALDLTQVPLQGLNLIEASAGTGKTYTLVGLYLRLLLEQSRNPEQILVLTYTKAATAELKQRIRRCLSQARQDFVRNLGADELNQHLLQTCQDRVRAVKQLDLAIAGFDQAAIYTIHGFCQRVLSEHAMESAQTFDVELVPDQTARLQQIADDFWRTQLTGLSAPMTDRVLEVFGSPEGLLADVRQGIGKPYLQIRSSAWPGHLEQLDRQLEEQIQALRNAWQQQGERVRGFLLDSNHLKRNVFRRDRVLHWLAEFQQWLQQEPPDLHGCANLRRFTRASLEAALRPDGVIKESKIFDNIQEIVGLIESRNEHYEAAIGYLRRQFYDHLCEQLPRRQQAAGEWSYDDLLQQLAQALGAPAGLHLAEAIRERFPVALVDEFQDTDPLQYDILTRIYEREPQCVFLVGDPKQAIYSFRGADIFAYLAARKRVQKTYSLEVNWRSSPQLIQALNSLFGRHPAPFLFPQIPYHPVTAANTVQAGLHEQGDRAGPLRIWQLPDARETRLPEARQLVADATADEIARLLQATHAGKLTLDDRPLEGGDIAVLVRKHTQAEQIAKALAGRGIHSVRTAQDNVFLSREAEQLERLLLALLEPRREALRRAALATDLLGWRGAEIDRLNHDDSLLGRQFERFSDYHLSWRDQGFIRMFRRLQQDLAIERRLLSYRNGERRLTNLYQLVELMHRRDSEHQPGMQGLVKWFSQQRQDRANNEEERQIRLESDSHLVKILTQHASKGLQFPVVFCPFLWDETLGLRDSQNTYLIHDPQADYRVLFEMGSPAFVRDQQIFKREQLAENLRLLYVALTRAQYRCYLPWGKLKNSENCALGWLLYPADAGSGGDPLASWQAHFKQLKAQQIQAGMQALVLQAAGSITLAPLPVAQRHPQLAFELPPSLDAARRFRGEVITGAKIYSYSSLVAGLAAELPDHDASLPGEQPVQQEATHDIHDFPRGAQPGTCLHSIFERLDFTRDSRAELEQLVATQLSGFGMEANWTSVIADMIEAVLAMPLDNTGLQLGKINFDHRITELGFYFPVRRLEPGRLQELARQQGFSQSSALLGVFQGLDFADLQGFMTGFIDLVIEWQGRFYLIDYKSNWLGEDLDAYAQTQLQQAMLVHRYPLQYLFYVLALHRYLARRVVGYDYDRHFGGVLYLFLRGMDCRVGNGHGVFRERPAKAFIEALDRYLAEGVTR
jgi:exodeoxyribonuclease V beta subunit